MKKTAVTFAAIAAIAAGFAAPASANLVQQTAVQLSGQGIGAVTTVLTLQSPGSSSTESGGVTFAGTVFGDAMSGASQSTTFTFATLGISSANQLGLVVNLNEPGSESPPSVVTTTAGSFSALTNRISLNVYSSTGTLLETHTLAADATLLQTASGVGGSGLVFALDSGEAATLNATILANAGAEVFTVGATFASAQGGVDVIQAVRLTTPVVAIPEPETYALMLAGLGALGFVAKRRKVA